MERKPFLMRFATEVPTVDPALVNCDFEYDEKLQANVLPDGSLLWRGSKPYTTCWTAGHYVKGHYTRNNKWVPGKTVLGKSDKRSGK